MYCVCLAFLIIQHQAPLFSHIFPHTFLFLYGTCAGRTRASFSQTVKHMPYYSNHTCKASLLYGGGNDSSVMNYGKMTCCTWSTCTVSRQCGSCSASVDLSCCGNACHSDDRQFVGRCPKEAWSHYVNF